MQLACKLLGAAGEFRTALAAADREEEQINLCPSYWLFCVCALKLKVSGEKDKSNRLKLNKNCTKRTSLVVTEQNMNRHRSAAHQ